MKNYSLNVVPHLLDLDPDEAGLDPGYVSSRYGISPKKVIVLSRNENPFGPTPRVAKALKSVALNRYPNSKEFIETISQYTEYPVNNILVGSGLDDVITNVASLFMSSGDKSLIPIPTYSLYAGVVELNAAIPIYLHGPLSTAVDSEMLEKAKMVFLCSPNNPTGAVIPERTIRMAVERTEGIVFLDEAYVEFAESSLIKLVREYENLIVGRTLSKAFGLAGLRLGYAVAPDWIVEKYRRISPLFGVSSLSLAAGVAALGDLDYMRSSVARIISERNRLLNKIKDANPSQANFLFIQTEEKSSRVVEKLLYQGIIVRDCSSILGSGEHYIRVTVGTPEENDRFLESFVQF